MEKEKGKTNSECEKDVGIILTKNHEEWKISALVVAFLFVKITFRFNSKINGRDLFSLMENFARMHHRLI